MFKTFAVAALVGATQAAEWGNRYTAQQFNVRAPAQRFGVYEPQMQAKTGYRGYQAQVYEPKQKFGVYEPGLKAAVPQYGRPSLDVHAPNQKFGVYEPDFKARAQSYGAPQTEVYEPRQKFGVYEPSLKAGYTRMRTNIHYDQPGAQIAHSRQGPMTSVNAGRARYDVLRNSALFDVDSRSAFVIGDRADDRNVRLFGDSVIGHRQSQAFVGRSQKVPNSVRYDNRQADVAVIRGQSKIYGRGDSEGAQYQQQARFQAPVQRQVSFGGNYGGFGGYDGGYNGGYGGGYGGRVGGYNGGYGGQSYGGYGGQSYGGYGGGYGYGAGQVDRDHDTDRRDNGGENSGISGYGGDRDPYDQGEYGARYDESANEGSFGKQVSNQDDDADGDDDDDRGQLAAEHYATSDRDVADSGEKGEGNDEVADGADGIDEVAESRADSYDGGHGHGYGYGRDLGEQRGYGYGAGYGGQSYGGYGGGYGGYGGGYGGYNGGW